MAGTAPPKPHHFERNKLTFRLFASLYFNPGYGPVHICICQLAIDPSIDACGKGLVNEFHILTGVGVELDPTSINLPTPLSWLKFGP